MFRFPKLLPAAACLAVGSSPAVAFFPPITNPPEEVVVVRPPGPIIDTPPDPPGPTPDPPFDDRPTPTDRPPVCTCPEPPDPHEVPEPAAVATALVGLGVCAAAGLKRKLAKRAK